MGAARRDDRAADGDSRLVAVRSRGSWQAWFPPNRSPMAHAPDGLTQALADRYTIEREIGAGGMATVYLAHDVRHDRDVALKVLRPELAAVLGRERFLAEIRNTAKLDHPHILTL